MYKYKEPPEIVHLSEAVEDLNIKTLRNAIGVGDEVVNSILSKIKHNLKQGINSKGEPFDIHKVKLIYDIIINDTELMNYNELVEGIKLIINEYEHQNDSDNNNIIYGYPCKVITPGATYNCNYALVDMNYLQPSNLPNENFAPNPNYPENCQTRKYYLNEYEKAVFSNIVNNFEPSHLINNSPDATTGSPIILNNGVVLGGNKRTMVLMSLRPDKYKYYYDYLKNNLTTYGFNVTDINRFGKPVLVRVLNDVDISKCSEISYFLNTSNMTSYSEFQEGKSYSRIFKENEYALQSLVELLDEYEFESMSELFSNNSANRKIVKLLQNLKIINVVNEAAYLTPDGYLTNKGKDMVEATFLATIINDDRLINAAKSFSAKIIKCLPLLFKIANYPPEYNLMPYINEAFELELERRNHNLPVSSVGTIMKLYEDNYIDPLVIRLYILLSDKIYNTKVFKEFLLYYTNKVDILLKFKDGDIFGERPVMLSIVDIINQFYAEKQSILNIDKDENRRNYEAITKRFNLSDDNKDCVIDKYRNIITEYIIDAFGRSAENDYIISFKDYTIKVYSKRRDRYLAVISYNCDGDVEALKGIIDYQGNSTDDYYYYAKFAVKLIKNFINSTKKERVYKAVKQDKLFSDGDYVDLTKTPSYKRLWDNKGYSQDSLFGLSDELKLRNEGQRIAFYKDDLLVGYINTSNYNVIVSNDLYYNDITNYRDKLLEHNKKLYKDYKTINDLVNAKDELINLTGINLKLLQKLNNKFIMLIWGSAGGGKSTYALMLIKDLIQIGKVLYYTTEESITNSSLKERFNRVGLNNYNVLIDDSGNFDNLVDAVNSNTFNTIVIDSVNLLNIKYSELLDLIKSNNNINWVLIAHSTKDGKKHRGDSIFEFYPDVVIKVDKGIASVQKNRYAKLGYSVNIFKYLDDKDN